MTTGALDHRFTPLRLTAALALGVTLLTGCGATPPPAPAAPAPAPERIDTGASYYESEIGGMDEYAVEDTFKALARPIARCFEHGSERVEQIGGSFTVSFRVDRKGKTRWAYMKASTIGDRETESCLLDIVRSESWPKPLSGEGLAEKTIDVETSRALQVLDHKRVRQAVSLAKNRTASCRKGLHGTFLATAYLAPNGKVRAAGVATPDEKGDAAADCITTEIQKLRFNATGKPAKVTFEI
jgi:hypothetical protein